MAWFFIGCGASIDALLPEEPLELITPSSSAIEETDSVIVKYSALASSTERGNLELANRLRAKGFVAALGAMIYDVDEEDTGSEVAERVRRNHHAEIDYIEIDLKLPPAYLTDDPLLGGEWHLPHIGATAAWDSSHGDGITVANLDTGTNCNHADLAANCVPGWNAANNNNDASDINGHGTLTAGTVASVGNNATGGAGVAFASRLMPIRIATDSTGATTCSTIANAIIWAADHGARVASNSYYIIGCSVVNDAANYMASKGGVYVRAAGNDNTQLTDANAQNVVVVSATDSSDVRTSWSNFGAPVDLAAPGTPIYCTTMSGGYGSCWGTSFSVPIVSGVLALMFSVNPALNAEQAKSILYSTAQDLGSSGWDAYYGYGRVDAAKAVQLAAATVGSSTSDTLAPSVPQALTAANVAATQVTLVWSPSTDNIAVSGYDVYRNGAKVGTASATSYSSSGLSAETSYSFAVAARDAAGNLSAQSQALTVTTPAAPFAITSSVVAQKSATGATVSVTTSAPSTVSIAFGTSPTQLSSTAVSATLASSHQVALTGLQRRTKYYFRVTATKDTGEVATGAVLNFRTSTR